MNTLSTSSMIIDGIAASEAIDSSGEILDVKGCDISDFDNGVGLLNYEHRGDDAAGASGNDIVGKIVYAKKIYKKADCEDARQEAYWDHVKLPFIYIKGRLYDGADHPGAKALAAAIRDAVMHKEPILARFSIEGSTLKKEGQRLLRTIARKVAITFKPANKSAISGLVSDPNASKPITEKQAEKSLLSQLLDDTSKSDIPGSQVLGSYEMPYANIEVKEDPAALLKLAAKNLRTMLKAMEAGGGDAAPSTLVGGAALQREDDRLHLHKKKITDNLRAAVRDLPDSARASKADMLKFFKFRLPEVNPTFLDHFTDLIDDIRTRQVGDWVEKAMGVWGAVKKAEERGMQAALEQQEQPEPAPTPEAPKIDYKPREEGPAIKQPTARGTGLTAEGQVLSAKLAAKQQTAALYDYGKDPLFQSIVNADNPQMSPDLDPEFRNNVLEYAHKPWKRAAASWLALNKLAAAGQLPASVIAHAAIFAAMSPNTSVPIQELYFGRYMDFNEKYPDLFLNPQGIDPKDAEQFHRWLNQTTPPKFFQEFYSYHQGKPSGTQFGIDSPKIPGATLKSRPQGIPLLNYYRFHPFMVALQQETKDDGRALTDYIMQNHREGDPNAMMPGFGPKLTRYFSLLMGQGNVIVPDRHFVRALFNLEKDDPRAKYLMSVFTEPAGERLLRGVDHHFFNTSPAVKKTLSLWPDHFNKREMQANALGFWLHWLCLPHYHGARGIEVENKNMGTAHDPYFKAIKDILDREGIPHSIKDPSEIYKSEPDRQFAAPLPARVARGVKAIEQGFGEAAASLFFYAYGVPALLAHERMNAVEESQVRKMESMAIDMQKLFGPLVKAETEQEKWPPEPKDVVFQGVPAKTGYATVYATPHGERVPEGRRMAIIGKSPPSEKAPQGDWLMVPHEKLGIHGAGDVERWGVDSLAEVHSAPSFTELKPGVVHGRLHVPDEFVMKENQRSMVHGLDMFGDNERTPGHAREGVSKARWMKLPNGKLAIVKRSSEHSNTGLQSAAHAEALYHNVLHFLGLGDYIPPTTVFLHPDKRSHTDASPGDWYSAQEAVPFPEHFGFKGEQNDLLYNMLKTGELDKLALVNQLMGNRDRHEVNYMFGRDKEDGPLKFFLIDHGHSVPPYESNQGGNPHYLVGAEEEAARRDFPGGVASTLTDPPALVRPMHPETKKWLMSLDPTQLQGFLKDHGIDQRTGMGIVAKLADMQNYAAREPNAGFREIWEWPDYKRGRFTNYWHDAALRRAAGDPAFKQRLDEYVKGNKEANQRRMDKMFPLDRAMWAAQDRYLDEVRRNGGADPDPYKFLEEGMGEEGAREVLQPVSGPYDHSKRVENFNRQVRREASRIIHVRKAAADDAAQIISQLIFRGHGLAAYWRELSGPNLDRKSEHINGPHRDGMDDEQYIQKIMEFLKPMVDRHLENLEEERAERAGAR